MTLSITHLQAILELADGPWVTRLIVPVVGLSTRPFIPQHKSLFQAVHKASRPAISLPSVEPRSGKETADAN